jgi:hypothetical protein
MPTNINDLKLMGDKILVKKMEFGLGKSSGGIIRPDDEMTVQGARPRWCQVLAVGPEVNDVRPGQYVLMEHGRWTRGFDMLEDNQKITVRMVDNKDMLLVSDEPTFEYNQSEKI